MPFVGFQKQQDDSMLAAFIGDSEEYLRNLSFVNLDKIEEHEFAIMYNGKIYLVEEELVEAKKADVRAFRNHLLETEVDPYVTNPLRWEDLSEEEKQKIKDYRNYLKDYTNGENWWEANPKTMEEWSAE